MLDTQLHWTYVEVTSSTFPEIEVGDFVYVSNYGNVARITNNGDVHYDEPEAIVRKFLVEHEERYTPKWVWVMAGLSFFFFWPGLLVLFVRESRYFTEKCIEVISKYQLLGRVCV